MMQLRTRTAILRRLSIPVGNNYCALLFRNEFELAVATILSAQCTDKRVNMVTPKLFAAFPHAASLAQASLADIAHIIASISFPNNKAKHLKGLAEHLMTRFGGRVPGTLAALITLPGIARKTANVVLIHGFGRIEGIPVDTHVLRVAHRIGLSTSPKDPIRTEQELMTAFPKKQWPMLGTALIHHGRTVCDARKPACTTCNLSRYCSYYISHHS